MEKLNFFGNQKKVNQGKENQKPKLTEQQKKDVELKEQNAMIAERYRTVLKEFFKDTDRFKEKIQEIAAKCCSGELTVVITSQSYV